MFAEVERQARIGETARGHIVGTDGFFPLETNPRIIEKLISASYPVAEQASNL